MRRLKLAVLMFMCTSVYAAGGRPFDNACMHQVYEIMKKYGMPLKVYPAVVIKDVSEQLEGHAITRAGGTLCTQDRYPIVYMSSKADCGVFAHEAAHALQCVMLGPVPKQGKARFAREMEAQMFEDYFNGKEQR